MRANVVNTRCSAAKPSFKLIFGARYVLARIFAQIMDHRVSNPAHFSDKSVRAFMPERARVRHFHFPTGLGYSLLSLSFCTVLHSPIIALPPSTSNIRQ